MKRTLSNCLGLLLAVCVLICASVGPLPAYATPAEHAVYLNGQTGDDTYPGTKESPVKTFEKAKDLLSQANGDTIYVTGKVSVPAGQTTTYDLGGKTLARGDGYHGELIYVYGDDEQTTTLNLKNIVIDGRKADGCHGTGTGGHGEGGSLIGVYYNNATLNIGEGAILQNNKLNITGNWYPEAGGAVFAQSGIVNLKGGTLSGNEAANGGAIGGYQAIINIESGSIEGNSALRSAGKNGQNRGGFGGGIFADDATKVNVSGGTIQNNSAFEGGGGIAVGGMHEATTSSPELTMTGGTLAHNTAGSGGGGIYVNYGLTASKSTKLPTHGIAHISGGYITNNSVSGTGESTNYFGGGGIYVHGVSVDKHGYHHGQVYLENVEVSQNTATKQGGGYASCPVSVTKIYVNNGAAFFGNTSATTKTNELYIMGGPWYGVYIGDPSYEISPSLLGGGSYRWAYDDGTEVPLDKLKGTLDSQKGEELSFSNPLTADDTAVKTAIKLAKVHISNNSSATYGGGIAANGEVIIGTAQDTTEIKVNKVWNDAQNKKGIRPKSLIVELWRDGEYVGHQSVTADDANNWLCVFSNLPKAAEDGTPYTYTVKERPIDGYTSVVSGNSEDGFTITNSYTPPTPGPGPKPEPEPKPKPESKPEPKPEPKLPATGDSFAFTGLFGYASFALAAATLMSKAALNRRKSR